MSYDVVLATYNGERYIKSQLESILSQSVKPVRILIRDDGSRDNTVSILRDIKKQSNTDIIIISDGINLGYIKNFEKLCELTCSEYIFFCDQDDIWTNNKAEKLLEYFSKDIATDVLFSDAYLIDNKLTVLGTLWQHVGYDPIRSPLCLERLLLNNVVTGATMAVRKRFLDTLLPFPEYIPHDYWIACNAFLSGKLNSVYDKLILYRQHDNNQIGAKKSSLLHKIKTLFNIDKREKRIRHYREIAILLNELVEQHSEYANNITFCNIKKYLNCVNALYANRIFGDASTLNLLSAISSAHYHMFSTKKSYCTDFFDSIILKLTNK
jgi:glycosyltransferase involved in cell wall biosynthesis